MKSISIRFALASVSIALFVLAFIGGINYYFLKKELLHDANIKAQLIEEHSAYQIQTILSETKETVVLMKNQLEKEGYSEKTIEKVLKEGIQSKTFFYGSAMAFEPNILYDKAFSPYYYKGKNEIVYKDVSLSFNYLTQEWYTTPKKANKAQWSEPYFDEGGGEIMMATYGIPITHKKKFAGILTMDISLENLQQIISNVHILKSGYAFLISRDNKILVHPNKEKILKTYSQKISIFNTCINKGNQWIYYGPIASTGLVLGIVLPENELFASLNKISLISIILAMIGSILLIATMLLISRRITQPLKEVIKLTQEISMGDFDKKITLPKVKDEIYHLAHSVNRMQDSIKGHMNSLKKATIKEQRAKSELDIANSIQMGMLPKALSKNTYLSIAATLKPARAVGGDFYDYFYIDKAEENLCFVIADVSGKGVPAAMFMAMTMSYMHAYDAQFNPSEFINKLNNSIAVNNDANMFVTLFMGILNIKTGTLSYVNAGHTEPYIIGNEGINRLTSARNPVVGAFEDIDYMGETTTLKDGEKLFLYTDGVTEAFSKDDEQFGERRVEEKLEKCYKLSANKTMEMIEDTLSNFTKGADEQSDDITILVISKDYI